VKHKYIEERYPIWFSMCISKTDISDINSIAFSHADSESNAVTLCKKHNTVIRALAEMASAWNESDSEAFKKYWYK
jgi:hypothetical protein